MHISRAIGPRTCHHLQFGKIWVVMTWRLFYQLALVGVGTSRRMHLG